jgi:uncharacterized membrane protein YheB (UPF0754 family)
MNKSLLTNFISISIFGIGFISPIFSNEIKSIGIFAISGGVTNWLAIHMLFEKVPFLYGSGIITKNFSKFKNSIRNLMLNEFFHQKNLEKFLAKNKIQQNIKKQIDFDKAFIKLLEAVEKSEIAAMLSMFGGIKILQPLRDPFKQKLEEFIDQVDFSDFDDLEKLYIKITKIIDKRLDELTPEKVKTMIQSIIKNHLGWLVVWGGAFGGLIGLLASLN